MEGLVKPEVLAYLAGFVDGEGTIGIGVYKKPSRRRIAVGHISLYNTDPTVPTLMKEAFGGSVSIKEGRKPHHNTGYVWQASGRTAYPVVGLLYPYLTIKRLQAETFLDFEEWRQRRRQELNRCRNGFRGYKEADYQEMLMYATRSKELNMRGGTG